MQQQVDVHSLLAQWRDAKRDIYAVFFLEKPGNMQTVIGKVVEVHGDFAIIADTVTELRIPIAQTAIHDSGTTMHDDRVHSLTLSWHDGNSLFVVTRA